MFSTKAMESGTKPLPLRTELDNLPLNLTAIGLVDRAYKELQATPKKEGWVDVCDALLAVASIFMRHAVDSNPSHDVQEISIIGKRARDIIDNEIKPEDRYSWRNKGVEEVFEKPNLVGAIIWLEPFFEAYVRATFLEEHRWGLGETHILLWLNDFLKDHGRMMIQGNHIPKTKGEESKMMKEMMKDMRATLNPEEWGKIWKEWLFVRTPPSACDYLSWLDAGPNENWDGTSQSEVEEMTRESDGREKKALQTGESMDIHVLDESNR